MPHVSQSTSSRIQLTEETYGDMGARMHGQAGAPAPWKCCKVFCALQLQSNAQ